MLKNIKYIEDDKKNGIEYDYQFIAKEYKKLVKDKEYQFPIRLPWGKVSTMILMSERSIGKTTNILLWGMLMHKHYNTIIHYVRTRAVSIEPKALKDLFTTIIENGYIEEITEGEYNNVMLYGSRWYYTYVDENGKIIKQSEHFMFNCSVDHANDLKSSYNSPRGDIIIFDEFIGKFYRQDEFIDFLDLTKTIIRDRFSATFLFVANVIDIESQWYEELECRELVYCMGMGERQFYETSRGQQNYIEIMTTTSIDKKTAKEAHNKFYYGYSNSKLNAITGQGWALDTYQIFPRLEEGEEITKLAYRYIHHNGRYVRLELSYLERLGLFVRAIPQTKEPHDSTIIYTLGEISDRRTRYGLGHTEQDRLFYNLYCRNKWYYSLNSTGAFCANYINLCIKKW